MMTPAFEHGPVTLYRGDCREVMAGLPDNSVDAIVTDPPYELGFMGKGWDSSGIAYDPEVWAQAFRVLKPGGHALVFGGTRTWHRVAVAIEDAGLEIRDNIAWLYGQGFPKSMNVAKAIAGLESGHGSNSGAIRRATMGDAYRPSGVQGNRDGAGRRDTGLNEHVLELSETAQQWEGWGTALKPAFEPVVVARKPLEGTVAANVLAYGTGALNIDAGRIGSESTIRLRTSQDFGILNDDGWTPTAGQNGSEAGRFPANVIFDESQAAELDRQTGTLHSGQMRAGTRRQSPGSPVYGRQQDLATSGDTYGDSGGGSRFFYVSKAGRDERPVVDGHQHATVKPLTLMRYLVTLVTPPGGTVLEPFAGSGTTLEAAVVEGFNAIGIELDEDGTHIPLIEKRLGKPHQQTLFGALL
ncbi:hypothetical protein XM48_10665 [Leucobacter sp. Ag1]|nr:hypothetical protein XM48_10665 [Leucobacter sp. Ag1]